MALAAQAVRDELYERISLEPLDTCETRAYGDDLERARQRIFPGDDSRRLSRFPQLVHDDCVGRTVVESAPKGPRLAPPRWTAQRIRLADALELMIVCVVSVVVSVSDDSGSRPPHPASTRTRAAIVSVRGTARSSRGRRTRSTGSRARHVCSTSRRSRQQLVIVDQSRYEKTSSDDERGDGTVCLAPSPEPAGGAWPTGVDSTASKLPPDSLLLLIQTSFGTQTRTHCLWASRRDSKRLD